MPADPRHSAGGKTASGPARGKRSTKVCEMCGNDYDRTLEITLDGETHVFDSFECAIHALAPRCAHCSCRIIGHGTQAGDVLYCCAHCAEAEGVHQLKDRV